MSDSQWISSLCMGCMRETGPNDPCPVCGFDPDGYEHPAHCLRPQTILYGKYLVGKVLGQGGFGITYIGMDLNLRIRIAIKEYFPSGFVSRENTAASMVVPHTGENGAYFLSGRTRFVEEAQNLARFYDLPGIVSVRDFFQENGTAYIVMEYVDGRTLKSHIAACGGKLPWEAAAGLFGPIISSLQVIHEAGIIHRDISPDNIMLTGKGSPKLLDFGAARLFDQSGERSLSVMLKPGYSPEEQYRSKGRQGPWTDVYALCATIYYTITGLRPDAAIDRLMQDDLKKPSELGIFIPSAQESALMRGLAIRQAERIQTMGELKDGLYGIKTELVPPLMPPVPPQPLAQETERGKEGKRAKAVKPPPVPKQPKEKKASKGAVPGKRPKQKAILAVLALATAAIILAVINPWGQKTDGKKKAVRTAARNTQAAAINDVTPKSSPVPSAKINCPVVFTDLGQVRAEHGSDYDKLYEKLQVKNTGSQRVTSIHIRYDFLDENGSSLTEKDDLWFAFDVDIGPGKSVFLDEGMTYVKPATVYAEYAISGFCFAGGEWVPIAEDQLDFYRFKVAR